MQINKHLISCFALFETKGRPFNITPGDVQATSLRLCCWRNGNINDQILFVHQTMVYQMLRREWRVWRWILWRISEELGVYKSDLKALGKTSKRCAIRCCIWVRILCAIGQVWTGFYWLFIQGRVWKWVFIWACDILYWHGCEKVKYCWLWRRIVWQTRTKVPCATSTIWRHFLQDCILLLEPFTEWPAGKDIWAKKERKNRRLDQTG